MRYTLYEASTYEEQIIAEADTLEELYDEIPNYGNCYIIDNELEEVVLQIVG